MIRAYYWNDRKVSFFQYYKNRIRTPWNIQLKHGNAGDIFNYDLIKYIYGCKPLNIREDGNRLLLVGSILSVLQKNDIVCGIGWKGDDLSKISDKIESAKVYGVRGPLTLSLFEKYGTDLSNLKFQFDPGLLVKEVYNIDLSKSKEKNVIFIPHFRDMWVYKNYPKNVRVVSIDNKPKTIVKEILNASIVYASSLHGIIFSHALNKPCVFVRPQSAEPIFKFNDYFLSMNIDPPQPIKDIHSLSILTDKATLPARMVGLEDFFFPDHKELKESDIIVS